MRRRGNDRPSAERQVGLRRERVWRTAGLAGVVIRTIRGHRRQRTRDGESRAGLAVGKTLLSADAVARGRRYRFLYRGPSAPPSTRARQDSNPTLRACARPVRRLPGPAVRLRQERDTDPPAVGARDLRLGWSRVAGSGRKRERALQWAANAASFSGAVSSACSFSDIGWPGPSGAGISFLPPLAGRTPGARIIGASGLAVAAEAVQSWVRAAVRTASVWSR